MHKINHYRADIDGLRAVAVLLVIFFHFAPTFVTGGYIGVDVFFTISGYLITGILLSEINAGRYSIAQFYERRIRRIYPALFLVLAATFAFCFLFYPPDLFSLYAKSAAFTTIFSSNIFFWTKTNYFDLPNNLSPLIHTWSLGVEEQFYIFFPIYLFAVLKYARRYAFVITLAIAVASLALSAVSVTAHPTPTFFLAPTRAWELLIGSLLAMEKFPSPRLAWLNQFLSVAGLGMIMAAGILYTHLTSFPGLSALLPCVGAALLIYSGKQPTLVGSALSWKPVVFVGLISYSLYLWHWPVLVAYKYLTMTNPGAVAALMLGVLSVALAAFSWKFVEQPFRTRGGVFNRKGIFVAGIAAMAVMFALGMSGTRIARGLHMWPEQSLQAIAQSEQGNLDTGCMNRPPSDVTARHLCVLGDGSAANFSFLVWGDSHALALASGISNVAAKAGQKGWLASFGSCPPFAGVAVSAFKNCRPYSEEALKLAAQVKTVILVARWPIYIVQHDQAWWTDGPVVLAGGPKDQKTAFNAFLGDTLARLRQSGVKVFVVAPVPEMPWSVPTLLSAQAVLKKDLTATRTSTAAYRARNAFVLDDIRKQAAANGAGVIYPGQTLCAGDYCMMELDGKPIYSDAHHLNGLGANLLDSQFTRIFTAAAN